jgi:hypothetical protein
MIKILDEHEVSPESQELTAEYISSVLAVENNLQGGSIKTEIVNPNNVVPVRYPMGFTLQPKTKGAKKMPVKLLDEANRQMPRSKVGKFSTLADVQEAVKTLANLPAGKVVQLTVADDDYSALKKDGTKDPARSIVGVLRRKFLAGGLPFKCYASDDKTITIMREKGSSKKK